MFLEGPSTRTMIEGFMSKEDRTFSEFEALIGFNLFEIKYELIQTTTLLYHEAEDLKTPCQIGQMNIHGHNIFLKIKDNNNAVLHIDLSPTEDVELRYNYRTDNFPSINLKHTRLSKATRVYTRDIDRNICSRISNIDHTAIMEILSDLSIYIPHLLWRVYQKKKMSDKNDEDA